MNTYEVANIQKQGWTLWHQDGRGVVHENELVRSSKDEAYVVKGGTPPHKPSSTGRVWVTLADDSTWNREFFPTVFNMAWRLDEEDKS